MADRYIKRDQDDYTDAIADLLPQGDAWPRDNNAVEIKVLNGVAGTWGNEVSDASDSFLVTESFPPTSVVLLSDWEKSLGLPDNCLAIPATLDARHEAIIHRMTLQGGPSRAFFVSEAAYIGYKIAIQEYSPYMCGISHCGDTRVMENPDDPTHFRWQLGRAEIRYYWTVYISPTEFPATDLFCLFSRYKPSHTIVQFAFVSLTYSLNTFGLFLLQPRFTVPAMNAKVMSATQLSTNAASLGRPALS